MGLPADFYVDSVLGELRAIRSAARRRPPLAAPVEAGSAYRLRIRFRAFFFWGFFFVFLFGFGAASTVSRSR